MTAARHTSLLIATIVALFAFFWQSNSCLAENAGLIPCHEHVDDASADNDLTEGHCCHVESTASLHTVPQLAGSFFFREVGYHACPITAPDAPITEIEYPPQLLS